MQLVSADTLFQTLRASGLFTPEQFDAVLHELAPFGADVPAVMKYLVRRDRVTIYQLKKVLNGRAADLRVGPYIIAEKIGEGGMGKVFRAQSATGGATVALKVVRAALVANPVVRGRYAREVQTASTLAHPNIVHVIDAGEIDGKCYMAMEFVDGIDLARLMRDYGVPEVVEVCEYVRQVALGLQHAHDRGFVHRDIKPSNIVVAGERHLPQATEPAVVKLLDLGLARAIDPDDMVSPDLTRDHTVVGTPDYMAPEQAKNSKLVGPSADLYGLGCTMYFLLTGRVPFTGKSAIEKILAHQSEMPPPLQALRPEVPTAVAQLVARMMAKRPEDRVPSAADLAVALEPYTRYPADAPPVPVVLSRNHTPVAGSSHGTSRTDDAGKGPSTFPSGLGSLVGAGGALAPSPVEPLSEPQAQPVAPSDPTPRPVAPAKARRVLARRDGASRPQHRAKRSHAARWLACAALALLGAVILALTLRFVSSS